VPSPLRSVTSLKSRWSSPFRSSAEPLNGQPKVAIQEQSHTSANTRPNSAAARTCSRPRMSWLPRSGCRCARPDAASLSAARLRKIDKKKQKSAIFF
jgi:hypothetical protein